MDDQTQDGVAVPDATAAAAVVVEEEKEQEGVVDEEQEEVPSEELLRLRRELASAREVARSSEMKCRQLQVLLEEEQFQSAQKAEGYLRQIQSLQAELRAVGHEMEELREHREGAISAERDGAAAVEDEMAALSATAEQVSAEQEADIAELQEELERARVELERACGSTRSAPPGDSEETQVDEQVAQLREYFERAERECQRLKAEFQRAQDEKSELKGQLAQLKLDLLSTKERNTQLCSEVAELRADTERVDSSAGLGDASEREGDGPGMELSDRDAASGTELRDRLRATRDRTQFMQEEYRDSRARVVEWQERCQWSENDRDWLGSELQRCHELLTSLEGDDDSSQKPWIKRIPMLAIVIAVAVATVIPRINKLMS
ncbi:sarcolemmal membrane-associated protein-like [Lethenteron reissneri]|uniref:sarcolemmal membrane-associated protein-like n=1 Tax=Lethenteron reissneri TaxID=7753 RepID=UPI002AB668E3|nr:sarcolemmal membrane-associated protein-like [Lethenteron reissneri]